MPEHPNSFDARDTLKVGDRELDDLPPRRAAVEVRRRAAALLPQDPAREPAAHRGQRLGHGGRHRGARALGREGRAEPRRSRSRPRACSCRTSPACPPSSTSPRCATRWPTSAATRRRSTRSSRPSWSSTTRCRSTSSAPRDAFARNAEREFERNQRALRVPALGPGRVRRLRASCRRTPGIVHQVNLEYLARVVFVDDDDGAPRLPRHARRHRLAHDDDQRPRRARLGRRRHRGRGGDARPADVDADPAGASASSSAASCPRARPRPTSCSPSPSCCARRASSASSSSSTGPACRGLPLADRATIGNMSPGVRLDLRDLPDRRRDAALPRVLRARRRSRSTSSRPTPRSRASGTTRTPRSRRSPTRSSSTSATSCRRWPARSARRTASR